MYKSMSGFKPHDTVNWVKKQFRVYSRWGNISVIDKLQDDLAVWMFWCKVIFYWRNDFSPFERPPESITLMLRRTAQRKGNDVEDLLWFMPFSQLIKYLAKNLNSACKLVSLSEAQRRWEVSMQQSCWRILCKTFSVLGFPSGGTFTVLNRNSRSSLRNSLIRIPRAFIGKDECCDEPWSLPLELFSLKTPAKFQFITLSKVFRIQPGAWKQTLFPFWQTPERWYLGRRRKKKTRKRRVLKKGIWICKNIW